MATVHPMRFGSLFAGIGGMDLGLERAGWVPRWQVEKDKFCLSVLAARWPDVKRYEDVQEVDWNEVERVDLVCGGFPCQPVSEVGARKGLDSDYWLWPEFARCLGVLRPRLALVENVSGLLTANRGRAMGRVLGDLADLGYDADWSVVSACALGAPHTRDRVFLVAHSDGGGRQAGGQGRDGDGDALAARRVGAEHLHPTPIPGVSEGRPAWPSEPPVGRMADGLSPRLEHARVRRLGNAVVPPVAELLGSVMTAYLESKIVPGPSDASVGPKESGSPLGSEGMGSFEEAS